jgi:hypothetical protein
MLSVTRIKVQDAEGRSHGRRKDPRTVVLVNPTLQETRAGALGDETTLTHAAHATLEHKPTIGPIGPI